MNLLVIISAYIYIFSFDFQNIFLKNYIGTIGMSGLTLIFPITLIIVILKGKYIKLTKLDKQLIYYYIYMILITLWIPLKLILFKRISVYYDENFIIKGLKLLTYNTIGFISIIYYSKILLKIDKEKKRKILNLNFILLFITFIYEKTQTLGRVKLLASEPSEAGYIITIMFILLCYYNKRNKLLNMFYLIIYIYMLLNIGSKGSILCIFLAIIVSLILKLKLKIYNILYAILILILSFLVFKILFYNSLLASLKVDLKYYTSIITRSFGILTGIKIFINNLFGVSGAYLYYFSKVGNEIYINLKKIYPNLNYSEIIESLKFGKNLSPKSGVLMDIILYGFYSIYFYIFIIKYFYKKFKSEQLLIILLLFTFISLLTYVDKYMTPTYILVITLLQTIEKENEEKNASINNNGKL